MCTTSPEFPTYLDAFLHRYQTEFGFVLQNRDVLVDDVRVRGIGQTNFENEAETTSESKVLPPKPVETTQVFFDDQYINTDVFLMEDLVSGFVIFLAIDIITMFILLNEWVYKSKWRVNAKKLKCFGNWMLEENYVTLPH